MTGVFMDIDEIYCNVCGSRELSRDGDNYVCDCCGGVFSAVDYEKQRELLRAVADEEKQKRVAALRVELWQATGAEFVDADKIIDLSRALKREIPDDFTATYYEIACGDNLKAINDFLCAIDVKAKYDYIPDVLRFAIKTLKRETTLAVSELIGRVYETRDPKLFGEWNDRLQAEAVKVDDGIYDAGLPRDVFVAYKSEDMHVVEEVVDYLERREGFRCFVAVRNLKHGKIADYDAQLETAIDNCRAIVFVSTGLSRRLGDARNKELKYIKESDYRNAPAEYRAARNYVGMPKRYKMPRVELVVDGYDNVAAEAQVREFFDGYERATSPREVAARLHEMFDAAGRSDYKFCVGCGSENKSTAKFCSECGGTEFTQSRDEANRTAIEAELRKKLDAEYAEKYGAKESAAAETDGGKEDKRESGADFDKLKKSISDGASKLAESAARELGEAKQSLLRAKDSFLSRFGKSNKK